MRKSTALAGSLVDSGEALGCDSSVGFAAFGRSSCSTAASSSLLGSMVWAKLAGADTASAGIAIKTARLKLLVIVCGTVF